jgi:ferritin-like metal-binding protein YciE
MSMAMASLKSLYLTDLADLYDAETQMTRLLPRFADEARAPELRDALRRHAEESRLHVERLELMFTHWGERAIPRRCLAVAAISDEADIRLREAATPDVRDAAIIGIVQRIEHYEIAAYGCARTYAGRLNRSDEERLLQETLDDEERADQRLTEIAEAHVNDDARSELDLQERPRRGDLRYLAAGEIADRRLPAKGVEVRNQIGEDLGRLDGFLVDPRRRPRYIVVDPRGLFTRRYIVPVEHVRFDEQALAFRVDLDKDVADRYPTFDADAFEHMDEHGWEGYEQSVLALFPPAAPGEVESPPLAESAPDWLLSGFWMTVPPGRAERLPDEARAFVNEFDPRSTPPQPAGTPESGHEQAADRPERERMVAASDEQDDEDPERDR